MYVRATPVPTCTYVGIADRYRSWLYTYFCTMHVIVLFLICVYLNLLPSCTQLKFENSNLFEFWSADFGSLRLCDIQSCY